MTPPLPGAGEGLNAAVAAEIRAELARLRRSTQWLSDNSGIAYGTLRRYLAAERHIDVTVLDAISRPLSMTASELITAAQSRVREDEVSEEPPSVDLAIAAHEDGSIAGEQESTNET